MGDDGKYCARQLTELDMRGPTWLYQFDCDNTQLTKLDFTQATDLRFLSCSGNQLTGLNLAANTNLKSLDCNGNALSVVVENAVFDLSTLPNFYNALASDWNGGTVSGNILTFHKDTITYKYDTYYRGNNGYNGLRTFMLIRKHAMAKPVFTPNGGAVERGSTVAIHCDTANATIYYTTNGSAPTVQSTVYTEPIVINEAMTIKAMAVRENYVNSEVATATFTVATVANETEQTSSLVVYAQDRTICLSEEAGEVSVYTMDGRRVFCGKAVRIPVSAGGLYIVHVAGRSYKLPVL